MLPAERNYHPGEQELLAAIFALKQWRCYLDGAEFVLVTDHHPNTFLPTKQDLQGRQARWVEYLQRFQFTWRYRPGKNNVADPLSRSPALEPRDVSELLAIAAVQISRPAHCRQPGEPLVQPTGPNLRSASKLHSPNLHLTDPAPSLLERKCPKDGRSVLQRI